MITNKTKKSEQGFAIALALLMMIVMSLMGTSLVYLASSDHKSNTDKDIDQQTFYAAETGIAQAQRYLVTQSDAGTLTLGGINAINASIRFCSISLFSNLSSNTFVAMNDYIERASLASLINATGAEKERLENYTYEYYITRTPDANGQTNSLKTKTVTGQTGTSIATGTSYKTGGSSTATYYTIWSCGCNAANCTDGDNVVTLETVVTLIE